MCAGVAAVTDQAGYGLLFVSPLHGSLVRAIGRATVDGFVAVGLSEDHPEVEQIRHSGLPMVLVDGGALPEHGLVESNDEVGARNAARHLLSLGHRSFVIIGIEPPSMPGLLEFSPGPTENVTSRRLAGYRQGLALGGVKLHDELIALVESLRRRYAAVPSRLIVTGEPPYPNAKVYSLDLMLAARSVYLRASASFPMNLAASATICASR